MELHFPGLVTQKSHPNLSLWLLRKWLAISRMKKIKKWNSKKWKQLTFSKDCILKNCRIERDKPGHLRYMRSSCSFCDVVSFYWKNAVIIIFHGLTRRKATGGPGGPWPPPSPSTISISELSKIQHFQFQTSAILLFLDVQKFYYWPEISQFLPFMLQFLDNLLRLFIFSNKISETDYFSRDLLNRSNT